MPERIEIPEQEQAKLLYDQLVAEGFKDRQKFIIDGKAWALQMLRRADGYTVVNLRNHDENTGAMGKDIRAIASMQEFLDLTQMDKHSAVTEKLPVALFISKLKDPSNFVVVYDLVAEFEKLKAANVNPREVGFQIDERDHRSNSELWESIISLLRNLDASTEQGDGFHQQMDVFSEQDGLRDVVYKVLKREKPKN